MDQNQLDIILQQLAQPETAGPAAPPPSGDTEASPTQSRVLPPSPAPSGDSPAPEGGGPDVLGTIGQAASDSLDAIGTGALKSVFETKDFIFGEPEQKSAFRMQVEADSTELAEKSFAYGALGSLSQFITGMIGLGKVAGVAKAVPVIRRTVGAITSTRTGAVATNVAGAAAVGGIVFDPHDPNLANFVQSVPWAANAITGYLAADPEDSAAEGRLKNVLLSIGMDAGLVTVFALSLKGFRAMRLGDPATATSAAEEAARLQQEAQVEPPPLSPDVPAAPADRGGAGVAPEAPASPAAVAGEPGAPPVVEHVPSSTTPAEAVREAGAEPQGFKPLEVTDQEVEDLIAGTVADVEAIMTNGSWQGAVEVGYRFATGKLLPWQRITGSEGVQALIARVADTYENAIIKAKGGNAAGVQRDKAVQAGIARRAAVFGEDPFAVMGMLQAAGKQAKTMAANLGAADLVANRLYQDSFSLAIKVRNGFLDEFGGDRAKAIEALQTMLSLATEATAVARSLSSNAGRTLRRSAGRFAPTEDALAALKVMDPDLLVATIVGTGGNPRALAAIASPGFLRRGLNYANFFLVNGLLWGWKTQVVNLVGNTASVLGRPAANIIGSYARDAIMGVSGHPDFVGSSLVRRQAVEEFRYLGAALMDSFQGALQAWKLGDSILTPHSYKIESGAGSLSTAEVAQAPSPFTAVSSIADLSKNLWTAVLKTSGLPTRTLSAVDELMRQTIYRSRIAAKASVEGEDLGLSGRDLADHIDRRTAEAFGPDGEGLDADAVRLAKRGVFAQELGGDKTWLGGGQWGQTLQNVVAAHPEVRPVLTFLRAPINLLKAGLNLTPGLAFLKRESWDVISGARGAEAQAGLMGQQAIGSVIAGLVAMATSQGKITGGGPAPGPARDALMATGWQPYAWAEKNEDGSTTFIPLGRFDPIGIPLSIVADITDIMSHPENFEDGDNLAAAFGIAFTHLIANRAYLTGISQAVDALSNPNERMGGYVKRTAVSYLPFSSLLNMVNPDPYMREVRSLVDAVMAKLPGFSADLPARYDLWGDPRNVVKGLWSTSTNDIVDEEIRRLSLETGSMVSQASPTPAGAMGADLREIILADGRDAFEVFQQLAGHPPGAPPLKDSVRILMLSPGYLQAFDGKVDDPGSRLSLISSVVGAYRKMAMGQLMADPYVRGAVVQAALDKAMAASAKPATTPGYAANRSSLKALGEAYGVDMSGLDDILPKQLQGP